MLFPAAFGLFSLVAPVFAQDPLSLDDSPLVFVAPFQARNKEAAALASLLPDFLTRELEAHPDLRAVGIDAIGYVHDTPAPVYAASCPAGQFVGCAFVMGEVAGARYALAGAVRSTATGAEVEVHVMDVVSAEERVSFQADVGTGEDQVFAEGVTRVLVAVNRERAGEARDIREGEPADDGKEDKVVASAELEALSREIGDVTTLDSRDGLDIERPKFTVDDLAKETRTDATKPWERLDMGMREYMRYRNSGLSLIEWRDRARGRKAQLLLRGFGGFGRAPVDGSYYGKFVRSADDFSIVESYAWQSFVDGSGPRLGGEVAYGIRPDLEAGLVFGMATGRYSAQIHATTEGLISNPQEPEEFANLSLYGGPQVFWAPLPTSSLRPLVGGRLVWWRGTAVDSHILPPEGLTTFSPPGLLMVGGVVGGEARLGERVDAWLRLPVTAVIAGEAYTEEHTGSGYIDEMQTPPAFSGISASLEVGIQVRLLGPRDGGPSFDDFSDPDE